MCDIFLCTYRCLSCWAVDVAAMSPVIPQMLQVRAQLRSVQGSWHSSEQPVLTEDLKQTQQTLSSCVGNLKKKIFIDQIFNETKMILTTIWCSSVPHKLHRLVQFPHLLETVLQDGIRPGGRSRRMRRNADGGQRARRRSRGRCRQHNGVPGDDVEYLRVVGDDVLVAICFGTASAAFICEFLTNFEQTTVKTVPTQRHIKSNFMGRSLKNNRIIISLIEIC